MKFGHKRDRRGRQCLRSRAGVVGQPQVSALGQKHLRSGKNFCVRAATHAPRRRRLLRVRGVFLQTFGRHPKCLRLGDNVCAWATTSALGRRRLPHAFISKAGFARPNCEYDKKEFLEPVQKTGNLKINSPIGLVHLKSTRPENRFQL